MSQLPKNWIRVPLDTFIIECNQRVPEQNEEFKYIDISSVNRDTKRVENPQILIGKDAPSRARKHVKSGDVLVSMTRPNLNAVALVPDELNGQIASTGFDVLRTSEVDPRWIFNLVRTTNFVKAMSDLVQGALYPAVRSKDIRGFEAPFAPLNEQKRIADKLDRILAQVDACREHLDRIPAILKRFRQSVLAAATSGKLTEEWRKTNCVTQTWTKVKLTDVGELNRGKSKHRPRNDPRLFGGNYPFIQTGDIAQSDGKVTTHYQTYSEFGLSQSKLWPSSTVCITIAANIADTAILTYPVCFPDSVVGFIADPGKCVPEFIKWSIDVISEHLESFAPATAQKNINLGILNEIYFLCPSIEEQAEVVRRVEELFAYSDRIEARYQAVRTQVDKLTPAILAKAFRGKLVPQDPNDEPASVLLERIRASRAENAVTPKSKRSRTIASRNTPYIV